MSHVQQYAYLYSINLSNPTMTNFKMSIGELTFCNCVSGTSSLSVCRFAMLFKTQLNLDHYYQISDFEATTSIFYRETSQVHKYCFHKSQAINIYVLE